MAPSKADAVEPLDLREPPGRAMGKVAELWRPLDKGKVMCTACARYCRIGEGQVGLCGVRGVHEGKLWLYVYGKVITGHVDPIEKKPVVHYRPGSKIFSIATTGCSWLCRYCFLPGTMVLTDRGQERIERIFASAAPSGDPHARHVVGRMAFTHRRRWRGIASAFEHPYSGIVMEIRVRGMDRLECTPDHRVYAVRKGEPVREMRADHLTTKDCLVVPRPKSPEDLGRMPRWAGAGKSVEELVAEGSEDTVLTGALAIPQEVATEDYVFVPVQDIRLRPYTGPVYNIEVEEDHSYTANFMAVANCQNFDISQRRKVEGIELEPQDVVNRTLEQGCQGLAYTYNEPSIFMEFARDIGVAARKAGLINIFVSNGYDTPESVEQMPKFLDCITVDFKGSGETEFVRKYIGIPNADPVFDTLKRIRDTKATHIEITDLVVPQVGDDLGAARRLARFVFDELGPDTPLHFLRFHPDYKMMEFPSTPVETLEAHYAAAKEEGLRYVYVGNVAGHALEHTYGPGCGAIAVRRYGFDITGWYLDKQNRCKKCGTPIPIVGSLEKTYKDDRFYSVLYHR